MKSALVIGLGVVFAAPYLRNAPAPQNPATAELENELSLVQIEEMRVISPDAKTAARLSEREEKLKYELLGAGEGLPEKVKSRRSSGSPERAASVPLCPVAASAQRTPRS